jgi:ATP-dependent exoDNAse (exonuclease V) alpha subunit
MFCFSRDTWECWDFGRLDKIMARVPQKIEIDEASMIGARMGAYLYRTAKAYRKQLILVGDWAQASPVKDEWAMGTDLLASAEVHKLTTVHRQGDVAFLSALNSIRRGEVSMEASELFSKRVSVGDPDDTYVRGYATNAATGAYNTKKVRENPENHRLWTFFGRCSDARPEALQVKYPMSSNEAENIVKESRVAHGTVFRIGARVIFTMNAVSGGEGGPCAGEIPAFVNGDAGIIEAAFTLDGKSIDEAPERDPFAKTSDQARPHRVLVRMDRTGELIEVPRMNQELRDPLGAVQYVVSGWPLMLGWSSTIHRLQGMTLSKLYVDMTSITYMVGESKHGLAYVALSRTRTPEGLLINQWIPEAVYCAPAVKPFI